MDIHISGSWYSRSIDKKGIQACLNAQREKDVVSLWGRIADWFLGTKTEAAKVALFRLAHSDTLAQQLSSFSELKQYAAPARQDSLTWQISDNGSPVFRIGDFDIRCHAATENTMANLPPFNLDERSRLLSSMYYSGENVVAEFHRFAGESSSLTKSDRSADAVLADQERFLTLTPSLLRALKLIGVDKNDVKGDFARDIGQAVERMVLQWTGDEGTAARAARNAENLSIFASNANAVRTVNVPDTSYVSETLDRRSDAAQLYGLDPALLDRPLDAIRAIRLKAQNSKEYLSPSAAALEWLGALCRAGLLHEANVAYTAFAKQYPRNANYVASIVPAKVLNHYWMSHLDHHGVQRSRVWQTEHPTWVDEGVQALHGGRLEKWAAQALDQIRMTRL